MLFAQAPQRTRRAFTLIELLTVVIIIGILAGLVTAAAIRVRLSVRKATIVLEIKQIEMALNAYKDRFGEFPPDDLRVTNWPAIRRHLSKAFPRYRPGVFTRPPTRHPSYSGPELSGWEGFQADVLYGWRLDIAGHTYGETITFFLGGMPEWTPRAINLLDSSGDILEPNPVLRFHGFSANPENPFAAGGSRIAPFYDFAPEQVMLRRIWNHPEAQIAQRAHILCWPKGIVNVTGSGAMAYFRAENGNYYIPGTLPPQPKHWNWDWNTSAPRLDPAWPAVDGRYWPPPSTPPPSFTDVVWINPRSFQLFSSGVDMQYGPAAPPVPEAPLNSVNWTVIRFPNGPYGELSLDDMANFTDGTLEDAMP